MKAIPAFIIDHLYIWLSILFTVSGQLILKWRSDYVEIKFSGIKDWANLLTPLKDIWVLIAYGLALVASVCWLLALKKFELTYAFPFAAISYVLILLVGGVIFSESITTYKIIGCTLIMLGIFVSVK